MSKLFVPSALHVSSTPRVDTASDLRDVLALVLLQGERDTHRLIIGLDEGRVIRVVAMPAELGPRARAQVDFHERTRAWHSIRADELYVLDVQAVEKQPDAPGADDPLFLYGVLRGPYPHGLTAGVEGIEGQLSVTRGELLDGFALGIDRAFAYEHGRCGNSCVHAALPMVRDSSQRNAVLAFPLVPMGDDGSNELVAAEVICDVLGAMREDLGDDLAADPVPVPNRAQYERELAAGGWTIKGDVAVHSGGKGRLASLFSPGKKQALPREASLAEYQALIAQHLARLPGWPEPTRSALHARLGVRRMRPPTNPGAAPPPIPPPSGPAPAPAMRAPTPPCTYCGARLSASATTCGTCGRPVAAPRARPPTAPGVAVSSPHAAATTTSCPYCAVPLVPGFPTCGSCGRPVGSTSRRPPTQPPPIPPGAHRTRPPTPVGGAPAPRARPPTSPPPFVPRNRPPTPPPPPRQRKTGPRTVMPGLTAPTPKEWIRQLIDDHSPPDRRRSRVVVPGHSTGVGLPDWMFDLIDSEFPDDDK